MRACVTHTLTAVVWSSVPAGSRSSIPRRKQSNPESASGTLLNQFPVSLKQLLSENESKEPGERATESQCGSGHGGGGQLSFDLKQGLLLPQLP